MTHPRNVSKGACAFLIIGLVLMITALSAKSIWDPFCKEDILYTPYVRVFKRGRTGISYRDRGPGFINLHGMKDIYVCTNGLVMLYYAKTRGLGELFEHGELQWTPHHCEFYNPSRNNGMRADHPKKTLLSILLIGHPEDYRRAALQMFVAPAFDTSYGDYVNLTSLIMMGSDGECIIEKGQEKARLRIRNQPPKHIVDMPFNESKPPIFCQLDAQRKLGQQGLITLAKPGNAGAKEADLFNFKGRNMGFRGTPLENNKLSRDHPRQRSETGPVVKPRYHASDHKNKSFTGALGNFADVADEVYAALIQDRKMEFVGCQQYPDFTLEQMLDFLEPRKQYYQVLHLSNESLLIKDSEPPFWAEQIPIPGADSSNPAIATVSRYSLYLGVDVSTSDIETYHDAKQKVDDAENLFKNKSQPGADDMISFAKERMLFSLWPFKKAYADLYKYVLELELQLQNAVINLHDNATGCTILMPSFENLTDPESRLPVVVSHWKKITLQNISKTKSDLRLDPYNRQLVDQYNGLVNESIILSQVLRKKSIYVGPLISNSEVLIARFKLYKNMLKNALLELTQAVTNLEKTAKPVDQVIQDPFERYYADIMIEIADAVKEDMTPYDDNPNAKACHELPSAVAACKSIKPKSERAGQLFINRQSRGATWSDEDKWRGKVLDLLEEIFQSVCPYIDEDFASAISKILIGYLLAQPLGTGLIMPVNGSRLQLVDHHYQATVYSETYKETDMKNMTQDGNGKLRPMQPFWEQISTLLEDCRDEAKPMQFWHNEENNKPDYVTYRKVFHNNKSEVHYPVDDLMMQEQADLEFVFNWAVEMNWRIFATVLGICMPSYENKIPLISARFYALYSQDFLHPLRQIWMSNRDNPVFQTIFGNYFFQGKAERWTKVCMESSFVESGDRSYRPPRHLYVNAFTEMNYFVSGPLAGTYGMLSVAEKSL